MKALLDDAKSVAVLRCRTEYVFVRLCHSLEQGVVLEIGKLLDTATIGSQSNLSLPGVIKHLLASLGHNKRKPIVEKLDSIQETFSLIRRYRHKVIAHNDLFVATHLTGIDRPTWRMVTNAIGSIERLFRMIESEVGLPETDFYQNDLKVVEHATMLLKVVKLGNATLSEELAKEEDRKR